MDQLHLMKVYVAVAEAEGFAPAARRLKLSPPAVTRAIATLEAQLKVRLLNRTTRHVRMTEAGERYLADSRRILWDVQTANDAAAGINATPKGHLSVTAPVLFGRMFVLPGIVEYLNQFPETKVDALFYDRVVNMMEEGIDVGVRIGELSDSSMQALRVGAIRMVLCASPEYLKNSGVPQSPRELIQHTLLASSAGDLGKDWKFYHGGREQVVRINPRMTVSTNDAAIEAAKSGLGITRLLSYQVAEALRFGELEIVLGNYEGPAKPVHIVHREDRFSSSKVRAFIDLMAEKLRNDKSLN